jgi:WD40 repeat protein
MSQTAAPDFLLESRGVQRALDAFVIAASFNRAGTVAAFALGDETVRLVDMADTATWRDVRAHAGAVLALAPDCGPSGFVTGGDDGLFCRIAADGTVSKIADFGMKWVEQVASFPGEKGPGEKGRGLLACAVGKLVHLFDDSGKKLKTFKHPSSVTGLAFDAKGKRVAASHYNGVTLWFVAAKTDSPRTLEWKGSHTALILHPDGDAVVTAMQESALHGWRLSDDQHMRMTGYPSKTDSLSFSRGGKWLASSGSDAIVLWPFHGGGPMGKAPMELAGGDGINCTQVACNPKEDLIAGGFADGLVVLADIGSSRILPVAPPGHGAVSALAWSPDGRLLALGTETGLAAIVDFTKRPE